MKCMTKYVALDVHQATTVASVRGEGGRVLARTVLPTEEAAVVLAPLVDRVVVCGRGGGRSALASEHGHAARGRRYRHPQRREPDRGGRSSASG